MRKKFSIAVDIPGGIQCTLEGRKFSCTKDGITLERAIAIQGTEITLKGDKLEFACEKANKKNIAMIRTAVSHVRNLIKGLNEEYEYKLEICHVHFPMTAKVEGDILKITNFLGEKVPRTVPILKGVTVEVKGSEITVKSHDIEKAGQTAANIEKATKVPKKDRRVFQDGIFLKSKPGGDI